MSEQLTDLARGYFQAPKNYFWRWAEAAEVVEWQHGSTLCYREELHAALSSLIATDLGIRPLGAVLLLLAGCNNWSAADEEQLRAVRREYGEFREDALSFRLDAAIAFLQQVAALPVELRTGPPKQHLLREVFNAPPARPIAPHQAQALLGEWTSGRLDVSLQTPAAPVGWIRFHHDLTPLATAAQRFAAPGSLELLLRTGLTQLPAPLPALPEPLAPAPPDLLDKLAQDTRTAGLARLSQQLGAALRIPLHTHGAGEQPLGGVADISNRGSFDRLLLSELAQDDLALTARLVNNEALYLRREAPPLPNPRPRTILLDTTLRLWGTPRVFALAAALAWARAAALAGPRQAVAAFALGAQSVRELDLGSLQGVVQALGQLDPALHCGAALLAYARRPAAAGADGLLITEAGQLAQPDFIRPLAEAAPALRFLLTVDRSGALELHEWVNGHRHLLATARYDLDALLLARPTRRPLRPTVSTDAPAFLQQVPAPLFYPAANLRVSGANTYYEPEFGVLSVSSTQRVLHWFDAGHGASEELAVIEPGTYCIGDDGQGGYSILVSGPGLLRAYLFNVSDEGPVRVDLSGELGTDETPQQAVFSWSSFWVRLGGCVLEYNCWEQQMLRHPYDHPYPSAAANRPSAGHVKRFVNNGYSTLQRVNNLSVTAEDELMLDGHRLSLVAQADTLSHGLYLLTKTPGTAGAADLPRRVRATAAEPVAFTANPNVLFRRFDWPDGSTVFVDSRGLLHLRSADAAIPELTVVLIIGQPTAAWASDGTVCGPAYFTGHTTMQHVSANEFAQRYLRPFIAHLG